MDELRIRRAAATDNRDSSRRSRLAERPDRVALWAVALAVVAMVAGVASARAGSSGGIGDAGSAGGTTAGSEATDCRDKDREPECDEFVKFDWDRQRATWYGPGFWGNETACGKTLKRETMGVAHKTLPCGSQVVFRYGGRYVRTRVIDRGPYANGAKWDLTQATAEALRFEYTDDIRVAKLGK
ncbi:MAG: septal ring lytic transglycosylase RlpA family protein [Solirubrobacterales bacterium]